MPLDLTNNQHRFRQLLGAVRQRAIAGANVDQDQCHQKASLSHNEPPIKMITVNQIYRLDLNAMRQNSKTIILELSLFNSPFVECKWSLFLECHDGTIDNAGVFSGRWVHEACLHHVNGRGHHGGAESCAEGGGEVAGQVVSQQAQLEDLLLDEVIGHQLRAVHDAVAGDVGQHTWNDKSNRLAELRWINYEYSFAKMEY